MSQEVAKEPTEAKAECVHEWKDQTDRWLRIDGASPRKCEKCGLVDWVLLRKAGAL